MNKFSFIEGGGISNTTPTREITIKEALDIVSSDRYKKQAEEIRAMTEKKDRAKPKSKLDQFLFGGTFDTRRKEGLKEASGIAIFDLDDIEEGTIEDLIKSTMNQ